MILLTIPHAGYYSQPLERHCDRMAKTAGYNLSSLLDQSEVIVIINYVRRDTLDMNRDVAILSDYRQQIRDILMSGHINLLLDIHSYPYEAEEFKPYDLVIIDEMPGTSYGRDLFYWLYTKGFIRIGYFNGNGNSIMAEGRRFSINSLLLEYGEFLTEEEITNFNLAIREWLTIMLYFRIDTAREVRKIL